MSLFKFLKFLRAYLFICLLSRMSIFIYILYKGVFLNFENFGGQERRYTGSPNTPWVCLIFGTVPFSGHCAKCRKTIVQNHNEKHRNMYYSVKSLFNAMLKTP